MIIEDIFVPIFSFLTPTYSEKRLRTETFWCKFRVFGPLGGSKMWISKNRLTRREMIIQDTFVPILSFLTPTYSEKQLWPTLTFHRHSVPARSSSWLFNSISLQNLSALFQPLVRFSIFVDFLKYTQILSIFPKYTQITVAAKNPLEGVRVHSVLSVRMQPKSIIFE